MTAHLPPNLLSLFQPRPPIPYVAPIERSNLPAYTGVSQFLSAFQDPRLLSDEDQKNMETPKQKKERAMKTKFLAHYKEIEELLGQWDPRQDANATEDAYKTVIVARLSRDTSEHKLRKEFDIYGPIKSCRLVTDKQGKPRGYAFIEFESERSMRKAYDQGDGRKIDGRRVVVDVERGRTTKHWRPRRLGGGLGYTRAGGSDVNQKFSGREPADRVRPEQPMMMPALVRRDFEPVPRKEPSREDDRSAKRRSRSRSPRKEVKARSRSRSRERKDRERKDRERAAAGSSSGSGGRERERERSDRDRERERGSDRDRERERERGGDRDRERERERRK
eukprot:TRINITY_DN343_c0_g1_i2.p1 TRINITY_DN343_c0_g1~~TRINITY_DN343_c0_g1_i2.p1  ORF type:complete len:335 (+),score=34.04 TRINITY_DN343_c0_g1_i2:95-1099(+)